MYKYVKQYYRGNNSQYTGKNGELVVDDGLIYLHDGQTFIPNETYRTSRKHRPV